MSNVVRFTGPPALGTWWELLGPDGAPVVVRVIATRGPMVFVATEKRTTVYGLAHFQSNARPLQGDVPQWFIDDTGGAA